jgi:hypothetical protein
MALAAATDPGGGEYVPLTPARIVDTRTGLGGYTGTLGVGVTKSFTVIGTGGVPSAVVLSVTGVGSSGYTYLAVYPSGESRPEVTQVSLDPGDTVANTVIAKVGTGGKVDVWNHAGSVSILLDVQGYFTDNTATTAGGGVGGVHDNLPCETGNGCHFHSPTGKQHRGGTRRDRRLGR